MRVGFVTGGMAPYATQAAMTTGVDLQRNLGADRKGKKETKPDIGKVCVAARHASRQTKRSARLY